MKNKKMKLSMAKVVAKVIQQANNTENGIHDGSFNNDGSPYLNDDDFFNALNDVEGLSQEQIEFAQMVGGALMIERMPKEMRDAMNKPN